MTMTDPIADFLTRIRNAQKSKLVQIIVPYSKIKMSLSTVLCKEGYINNVSRSRNESGFDYINIDLKYSEQSKPAIVKIDRVSKPGRRVYSSIHNLKDYYKGLGIYILTTSKGVISNRDALTLGVGGEVLCKVF